METIEYKLFPENKLGILMGPATIIEGVLPRVGERIRYAGDEFEVYNILYYTKKIGKAKERIGIGDIEVFAKSRSH